MSWSGTDRASRHARATLAEARRLWRALDRENVMIKVPGTPEALPAIRRLLVDGVNVNVTLLFSREAYRTVAELAYQDWRAFVASERWRAVRERGAMPQRLLWASTGTKDPRYRDVLYVEELIGPETVNTVPLATFEAFRDHGRVAPTLEAGVEDARAAIAELGALGVAGDDVRSASRRGVERAALRGEDHPDGARAPEERFERTTARREEHGPLVSCTSRVTT